MYVSGDENIFNARQVYRNKRNVGASHVDLRIDKPYTIEVLVVVDRTMQEFHGTNNITNYVLMLMSIAAELFADASIGNLVDLAVVDVVLLQDDLNVKSLYSGKFCVDLTKFLSDTINFSSLTFEFR